MVASGEVPSVEIVSRNLIKSAPHWSAFYALDLVTVLAGAFLAVTFLAVAFWRCQTFRALFVLLVLADAALGVAALVALALVTPTLGLVAFFAGVAGLLPALSAIQPSASSKVTASGLTSLGKVTLTF